MSPAWIKYSMSGPQMAKGIRWQFTTRDLLLGVFLFCLFLVVVRYFGAATILLIPVYSALVAGLLELRGNHAAARAVAAVTLGLLLILAVWLLLAFVVLLLFRF